MSKRMSDAAIEQYIAEIRKWPKRPTDYDATTEDIIRRILRGEIVGGPDGNSGGEETEPETVVPSTGTGGTTSAYDPTADVQGCFDLALEELRKR